MIWGQCHLGVGTSHKLSIVTCGGCGGPHHVLPYEEIEVIYPIPHYTTMILCGTIVPPCRFSVCVSIRVVHTWLSVGPTYSEYTVIFQGYIFTVLFDSKHHVCSLSRVYLCKQWNLLKTFTDHTGLATGVRFGKNTSFLASVSMDRNLKYYGI